MRTRTLLGLVFFSVFTLVMARALWSVVAFREILVEYKALVQRDESLGTALSDVAALAIDLETGVRGWLVTGDPAFREPYDRASAQKAAVLERLARLEAGGVGTRDAAENVRTLLDSWDREIAKPLLAADPLAKSRDATLALNVEGKARMDATRAALDFLRGDLAERHLVESQELASYEKGLEREALLVGSSVAALLFVLALAVRRGIERPLTQLAAHVTRVGTGEVEPIRVAGVHEVTVLAATLSSMAERLAHEREREQRFTELVSALSAGGDVATLARVALKAFIEDRKSIGGVFWIARDGDAPLTLASAAGFDREALPAGGSALAREVRETGNPSSIDLEGASIHVVRSAFADAVPRSVFAAPIRAGKAIVGVLELAGPVVRMDEDLDRSLTRVGLALQNAIGAERTATLQAQMANLNEELQAQNEELRTQEEELRVQSDELLSKQSLIAERNESLERASRLKSDFLSGMSHELRTPLNAVIGFADLLLAGSFGAIAEPQHNPLADILAAGKQLLTLVNDILDLSKIEAGKLDVHIGEVDLDEVIGEALSLIAPLAAKKKISVARESSAQRCWCSADRDRTRQVLLNLLSNAVKFTGEGGNVRVAVNATDDTVEVAVRDDGIGIAEDDARRLFQPFTQVSHGKTAGTGLGLSISRRLLDLMHGTIGVTSAFGRGSTFTFTLPRHTAPRHTAVAPKPEPTAEGALVPATSSVFAKAKVAAERPTILIVDDEPSDARVAQSVLAREGYVAHVVPTAESALAWLGKGLPDLLVVDLGLPGISGIALIERVRATPSWTALPIVVLTARDLTPAEHGALASQVSLVAQKGIMTGGGFLESIATLCREPRRPLRVLIIDDSATNRRVVGGMLTAAGHAHTEADNAASGIEMARTTLPDVILMDVRMPEMDGLEATRILRGDARTRAIPIIAVSAQAMLGDREKAIDAGCVAYVTKPVARVELVQAIERVVTLRDHALPRRTPAISDRAG